MWLSLFTAVQVIATLGWVALILFPRLPFVRSAIMYGAVGLLCLTYAILLGLVVSGSVDPVLAGIDGSGANFTTIAGVRAIFASDGGVVIGWTHYLAFDLFTGLWIASDADNKGYPRVVQVPFLALTFLVGPVGLLCWLLVRERRARAAARAVGKRA